MASQIDSASQRQPEKHLSSNTPSGRSVIESEGRESR
jgi:hypothetical protein